MIALPGSLLRVIALLCTSRNGHEWVYLVEKVYIRGTHNRVVELDVAPQSTAWWATQRALIALDDPRDAARCRLLLHREPLHPRRSLARSGVRHGDTLDLVAADAIPRRPRRLLRVLNSGTLARLGVRRR